MTIYAHCLGVEGGTATIVRCLGCASLVDCYPGTVIPIGRLVRRVAIAVGIVLAAIGALFLIPWSS